MPYSLAIKPSVLKDLQPIPKDLRGKIALAILELSREPRPASSKKLSDGGSSYRVRVGEYRILYEVSDAERIVRVMAVGHRREVYR
jgi:mRNA interferase RelE/StbE